MLASLSADAAAFPWALLGRIALAVLGVLV